MGIELIDPLRHNAWATQELLAFCERLTPEQLEATSPGTYGNILSTLQHIVGADGRYVFRLTGAEPGWARRPEETADLAELARMSKDLGAAWDELASGAFDPERTIASEFQGGGGGSFEVKAGILVAQALNHGNEHRGQIYTILTTIGVEPPHLDGWAYGIATGRFVEHAPDA